MFGLRSCLSVAWEVVSRWEIAEPSNHRVPLPEPLLHALLGLALGMGWKRFALVTFLAFYAVARPGELLKARRQDVLTAKDLLTEPADAPYIFIKVEQPKTRRRGARVQHCKFGYTPGLRLAEELLRTVPQSELLYPGSPSCYRRRWDFLMGRLGVGKKHKITPGSLRSGGAGTDLTRILWAMRLKSLQTLAYYLQEVAADTVLTSFDLSIVQNIKAFQAYFKMLLRAVG